MRPAARGLALGLLLALAGLAAAGFWRWSAEPVWRPAFIAPLHPPITGDPRFAGDSLRFADQTLRQFVPLALPGRALRLRFSNQYGDAPLHLGEVRVAWRAAPDGPDTVPGSDRALTFDGASAVIIPPGGVRVSDPVVLDPPPAPGRDLAVSLVPAQPTPTASWHWVGGRSTYRSPPGAYAAAARFPVARADRSVYFLAAVEVDAPADAALWVAFGDSITDGAWHTVDRDASWPALWGRAWAGRGGAPAGVLNAGLSGNQLLARSLSEAGLARLDRDLLDLPGVRGVVVAIGINDLGGRPVPDAQALIAGLQSLVARCRARGLRVVGSTLLPVAGSDYDRPEVEAARQQVNAWIRTGGGFDAVVDFDAVVRDPALPARFRPGWASDGLHPTDLGYRAMADAVVATLDRAGLAPLPPPGGSPAP